MERYRILALAVELIFFFFFLEEEHLLKCASAELPSRHEMGGGTLREDAEEEGKQTNYMLHEKTCSMQAKGDKKGRWAFFLIFLIFFYMFIHILTSDWPFLNL